MNHVIYFSICIFMLSLGSRVRSHVTTTTRCEYYNETSCRENSNNEDCFKEEECEQPEAGKRNHCFVLWQNGTDYGKSDGKFYIKLKGCFLNNIDCYDKRQCVEKREPKKFLMFCCCEGDMCNKNFTWEPISTTAPTHSQEPINDENDQYIVRLLLYTLIPLLCFALGISVFLLIYRHKKLVYFNEIPTAEPHPLAPDSPMIGLRPIQLLEIKAQGRHGAIWKAQFKSETVAIKIFSIQDKQPWLAEQEIFKLERMNHENILKFLGAEHRANDNPHHSEYWLITAFHERGSLCDFLKSSIITWPELCHIAVSMARGLMHIHEEILPSKGEGYKPAIAHRDFKSKNVLLKADLTACIADFDLALVFEPGKPCGDTHGQVGTRRYMAPEVLEGAINFSRDAFLRIDMYACGMVLWELASRCTAQEGPIPEYQLPFEEEVGQHPTLEDMQECVVQKKQRPTLKETWKKHSGLIALCDTMEECWDHDAEARLSASCVVERLTTQMRSQPYICSAAAATAPDSVGIGKESSL